MGPILNGRMMFSWDVLHWTKEWWFLHLNCRGKRISGIAQNLWMEQHCRFQCNGSNTIGKKTSCAPSWQMASLQIGASCTRSAHQATNIGCCWMSFCWPLNFCYSEESHIYWKFHVSKTISSEKKRQLPQTSWCTPSLQPCILLIHLASASLVGSN